MKANGEKSRSLLRFTTAGSVDDGKSTLIGRLLYDSKSIFEDQLEHIIQSGKRLGREEMDLSLLTDGLRAEREQGITIDVAYRYFATPKRKFIIADTPGHIQYTRNMVTGASTADLAVILIDARKGVLEQTIRHTYIAYLLDIRHIIFCINKMDMAGYSENRFNDLRKELTKLGSELHIEDLNFIPVSAKNGDNIVEPSENMKWYRGTTFLNLIETIETSKNINSGPARFPVQTVIRPISSEHHDYRGYAGQISSGMFHTGEEVTLLPTLIKSKIASITMMNKNPAKAFKGDSATMVLEDQIDISRGNIIVKPGELPSSSQDVDLMVCWLSERPLKPGSKYLIKNNTNETRCIIRSVNYRMNIENLKKENATREIVMNDIANISIKTSRPIFYDPYRENNLTGSLIFIEEGTNQTAGAGMIC